MDESLPARVSVESMAVPCRSELSPRRGNPNCDESIVAKLDEGKVGSGKKMLHSFDAWEINIILTEMFLKNFRNRKFNKNYFYRSLQRRKWKQSGRNIPCAVQDCVTLSTKNYGILKQYG